MKCIVLGLKDGCSSAYVLPFGVHVRKGQRIAIKKDLVAKYVVAPELVEIETIEKDRLKGGSYEVMGVTEPRPVQKKQQVAKKNKSMSKSAKRRTKKV